MAFTHQMTANGAILRTTASGKIQGECCCEETPPVNPCSPDPEMLVTVSGATGTINWCGEQWILPGDSGVQKSVCPTAWGITTYAPSGSFWRGGEFWENTSDNVFGLERRAWAQGAGGPSGSTSYQQRFNLIVAEGSRDKWLKDSTFTFTRSTFDLGVMSAGYPPLPTPSDYKIHDGQFGSYETGGITYTWARGAGW